MADDYTDPADDSLLPEQQTIPIPGGRRAPGQSITGIGRINSSPGLWGNEGYFGDVNNVGESPGLLSTLAKTGRQTKRQFFSPPAATADLADDTGSGIPTTPVTKKDLPPLGTTGPFSQTVAKSPMANVAGGPFGDSPPLSEDESLAYGPAKPNRPDDSPAVADVWTKGTGPIPNAQYGGAGMAYTPGSPRAGRSDDDPGSPRDITPQGGGGRSDARPALPVGENGLDTFGNSMIGRAFNGLLNWRDQNRMTLMAMAGGLAGAPSLGAGLGRGFTAGAATIPQQNALNNQNATMQFFMSPKGGSMDPNMARAFAANPALTQEALGQISGYSPPKTLSVQPGQNELQWDPRTRTWKGLNGAAAGTGNTDTTTWDAMSTDDRLAQVAQQYGPEWAAGVKAIGEGRAIPPNRLAQLFPVAQRVYPGLDMNAYNARTAAFKNFYGGGKVDTAIKQFDQAIAEHAAGLPTNVEKNANLPGGWLVNQPLNAATTAIGTNTTYGPLQTNATALTDELAGLWKATGATDNEIKRWTPVFPVDGTIPQQKAAVGEIVSLAEGAMNALEKQKERDFQESAGRLPALMSPSTRATLDRLKAWAADPNAKWEQTQAQPAAGQARPAAAPAAAAPQQAPQVPPPQQRQIGQIYNTPKGPMRWMADGWHPVQ